MSETVNPTPQQTPTPAATTTVTRENFWTYLTTNIPNHLLLFGGLALIAALIIGINMILDLKNELAEQEKVSSTLSQKFEQIGTTGTVVTGNASATATQVATQASNDFGAAVVSAMAAQNAKIQSLSTIVGQVAAQNSTPAATALPAYTPTDQNVTTGKLTGYPIEVSRDNAPALDAVHLFYDPSKTDPTQAFAGTTFQHYNEQFTTTVGDWELQKTGGYRTTVKLSRTVTKPNPADPTKTIVVGTEDIPLSAANTVYSPAGLDGTTPLVMPRWTLNLGASKSTSQGYQAAATIDYRITDRFGVFAGTANSALVGGVSIRLGGTTK
jgi:hypothetical protein